MAVIVPIYNMLPELISQHKQVHPCKSVDSAPILKFDLFTALLIILLCLRYYTF